MTVTLVTTPSAVITADKTDICEGDTATIQASTGTGYEYTWFMNNNSIPGASTQVLKATKAGVYSVTISNGGCVALSNKVQITTHASPLSSLRPSDDTSICNGDQVTFSMNHDPAFSYQWYRNNTMLGGQNANTYTTDIAAVYKVKVSSSFCPELYSPPITVSILPSQVNVGPDTVICDDVFSYPLSVPNGFDAVLWSDGSTGTNTTVHTGGLHWVEASNKCGVFRDTMKILVTADFQPVLPADTLVCNFDNALVLSTTTLSDSFTWSTGETSRSVVITKPGKYWLEVKSPCGILSDSINVDFCKPLIEDVAALKDSICEGDCISFEATVANYPQTYYWTFEGGNPGSSLMLEAGDVCYTKEGTYPVTLVVTNAGGADTFTRTMRVLSRPVPRFADTTITVPYKTILEMPACAISNTADWYKGDSLVCANCKVLKIDARDYRSVYHCIVRNGECPDSCIYKLQVIDIPNDVWLPDIFSPNRDGKNDIFHVVTDNPNILVINLSVNNRWGQRVFMGTSTRDGWDGTHLGEPVDVGTYFWTLRYKVMGSEEIFYKKGDINVIR